MKTATDIIKQKVKSKVISNGAWPPRPATKCVSVENPAAASHAHEKGEKGNH
jgi:hypothetical protein